MDKIADTSPAAKPAKITPDYTFLRRAELFSSFEEAHYN
jgi:hypothetical protein